MGSRKERKAIWGESQATKETLTCVFELFFFYFSPPFSALILLQDLQSIRRHSVAYLSLLLGTREVPLALSLLQNEGMKITC